jgi:integrase
VDGKYYSSKSGFKTKTEAKKAGDKAAVRIKNPVRPKDSFKTIAELYIADGYREKSTIYAYKSWLKVFEPIHDIEMLKLSYADVAPVIHDYYLTHKYNGSQSMLRFGKSIINYAIDKLDYDMKNPFNKIKLEKKSENAKKEHQILTMDEMLDLIKKIEDPDIRFLTAAMGLAGLRISEARGLTYKSFGKDSLTVDMQRQRVGSNVYEKNNMKSHNSKRVVPLDPNLKKEYKERPISLNKSDLIISEYYSSIKLIKYYRALGYQITPHSLRHSYSTYCIQQGIDFKTLSELIGDSMEVTMRTYSHVNSDMMDHARKVLTKSETI